MPMRLFFAAATIAASVLYATPYAAADSHAMAMHGTPKYGPDFTHFDYVNPNAPKGGTVRLAAQGTFDNFNSFIVKGNAAPGLSHLYDTLMVHAADEAFTEYGHLAESVRTPEDRSWVEFTLREGARWHDGAPVTAADVVWTFETLIAKGAPSFRFYYDGVADARALDARTVRFAFKPGDNRELPLILGQLTVLPKHYWQGRDFEKTTLDPPLGSGPYRIGAFETGRNIVYERVPDYWAADLPTAKGTDNFGRIRYDMYRDRTIMREAFKGGAFDLFVENLAKAWATAYKIPQVERGLIELRTFPDRMPAGMQAFAFNLRREIFQDPKLRQAMAYAFDFEWTNANLFYGQYHRSRSFFDNSDLAATGLPSPEELAILEPWRGKIPDEAFTAEYAPPSTKGGSLRQNLKAAVGLLKQSGWELKGRKLVNRETGKPLEFEILLTSPAFERIVLPFAKNLERIGIDASVRTVDTPQYIRRLEAFDFDMIVATWGQSLSPGNEQRDFWGSAAAEIGGSRNLLGIEHPAVDALIETLVAAPDRNSLVTRVRALDRVLQWGHYVIPQWHYGASRLAFWDIFGIPDVTPLQGVQLDAWWVDPEKRATLGARKKAVTQ